MSVRKRLGAGNSDKDVLAWTLKSVDKALHQEMKGSMDHFVGAVGDGEPDEVVEEKETCEKVNVFMMGDGIVFEIPKEKKLDGPHRAALKKIHCNLGHPSEGDLKRFLKNANAPSEMIEAIKWLKCSACARSARPRIHRSTRMPPHDIQFNDQVLLDCFYLRDGDGDGCWFLSVLDRSTMFHQVSFIKGHTPEIFRQSVFDHWIRWAGLPAEISVDLERGLVSREFVDALSEAGVTVTPIAGQAHWQHGKIERHGSIVKDMMKRVISETGVVGEEQMDWVAVECTHVKNNLVREHGFSPAQLLFGKEPRGYGELWENGEPCALHFDAGDPSTRVAARMKYRHHAKLAYVHAQASQLLNRTVRNKTRAWAEPNIGDQCFFYREIRKKGIPGKVGKWLGPALVVGLHGNSNLWITYSGKCYLVAQEHCREAIGEEAIAGRPEVQEALKIFQDDRKHWEQKYLDLSGEPKPPDDSLDAAVGEDDDMDEDEDLENQGDPMDERFYVRPEQPPKELVDNSRNLGWHDDILGNPYLVSMRAYAFRIPLVEKRMYVYRTTWAYVRSEWFLLEDDVRWDTLENPQDLLPGGVADILITYFRKRTKKQICEDSVPECLKIKKQKTHAAYMLSSKRKAQKALDKEIPYHMLGEDMKPAFDEAIRKEWASWEQYEAANPLSLEESQQIIAEKPERVLRSRYVLRNKNAGLVDEKGEPLGLRAKARLCVQGQHDPDCQSGDVKVDSPTIQHTSLLLFLHAGISFGWVEQWRCGDISSAFLQGKPSTGEPLYMYPPKQGIPGIGMNQILQLLRPVYGRPDAPRAWYESLASFITGDLGYEVSLLDPALFFRRNTQGEPTSIIVIHVDDLMIAGQNDPENEALVEKLRQRFPFGEWDKVMNKPSGITYCGKEIRLDDVDGERCIKMSQHHFASGRLELIPISADRMKDVEATVTEAERTDFRSVLGALQWMATQSRADIMYHVNQLQKRVNKLQIRDLIVANRVVRLVKKHPVEIVFRDLGREVAVASYHDASLYNSLGVEIDDNDGDLVQSFGDKKLLYSQKGCMVGFVRKDDWDRTTPASINWCGWRSKTNKRIVESSFQAETHGALLGHGMGHHLRALYAELCFGKWILVEGDQLEWDKFVPLVMCTDCKSIFDCIRKDGHSIGDKGNAINVAILRQLASTEKSPSGEKARLLWLPTRLQCADGLTKQGCHANLQSFLNKGQVIFHGASARELQRSNRDLGQCEL